MFELLAPEMQIESPLTAIAQFTATNILAISFTELRPTWPIPRNTIRAVLADLAALGCVVPSSKKKPLADQEEYWSLAEFGVKLLSQMRRRRLERLESLAKLEKSSGKDSKSDL
jgi:hypothetical protein